jgi:hypothetical protein
MTANGCDSDDEILQGVLVLPKTNPSSGLRAPNHPHHMVVYRVGPGSFGPL